MGAALISKGAALLELHLKAEKIPYLAEFPFHPSRRWRADFRILGTFVLVEVDGGNRMAAIVNGKPTAVGRHTRDADYEKLAEAAILGYRVLRFSPAQVKSGYAIDAIKRIML
jgi:very-short-patch-repair endonuclease